MKRRITLSIAFVVSVVLLSLLSSDSTTQAQKPIRFTADTGMVTLGPNQMLRMTVVNRGKADADVRFTKMEYSQGTCNGGVCSHVVASETTSAPMSLAPGEGASTDILCGNDGGLFQGVRGMVVANNQDVRVNCLIINTTTGQVDSWCDRGCNEIVQKGG